MLVSVVVPTYDRGRFPDMVECVETLLRQTYDDIEVVIVVDGNPDVFEMANEKFSDKDDVIIYNMDEERGPISRANMGVVLASGEIVALTDDDAVPAEDWVETLVDTYERYDDAIAVGGKMEPEWVVDDPGYIPEEFQFLIGVSHRGFPETEQEVRNTFGANLSFKRDVYLKLGGIKQGGIDPSQIQGRETEFCARMRRTYGKGVIYNPEAVVRHKIYDYRTDKRWLIKRAFWQGYSKRAMSKLVPDQSDNESEFVRDLFLRYLPDRVKGALFQRSQNAVPKLMMLLALTAATGIGYLWGIIKWR